MLLVGEFTIEFTTEIWKYFVIRWGGGFTRPTITTIV